MHQQRADDIHRERQDLCREIQLEGRVVHGFGRGSKELGCPTANIPTDPYGDILDNLKAGIYYGQARVDSSIRYPAVISIGWNPHFRNEKKTIEAHLMHKFPADFYDSKLTIYVQGYIRPEYAFESIDGLKKAIDDDIKFAKTILSSGSE